MKRSGYGGQATMEWKELENIYIYLGKGGK